MPFYYYLIHKIKKTPVHCKNEITTKLHRRPKRVYFKIIVQKSQIRPLDVQSEVFQHPPVFEAIEEENRPKLLQETDCEH